MKNSKSNRLLAMMIIALSINSQSLLSQCISCDSTQSNVTVGFNNNYSSNWWQQTILGNYNTTSQNNTVVIGTSSTASRSHSYIFGSYSQSNGLHSYVIGSNSIADKTDNFAIGNTAQSMSGNGFAIGNYTKSLAEGAYVLGLGRSITIPLEHNVKNSLAVGFKSNIPTLFVSESPNVNRTGRIGIGNVTAPQAKLHIRADAEDDATLRLEATGDKKVSRILFSDEHFIQAVIGDNMFFNTQREMNFIFQNGNVGIGVTNNPQDKLDVLGSIRSSLGYKVGNRIIISSSRNLTVAGGVFENNISVQGTSSSAFNGSLGIGTISPREKLEVVGFIRTSSGYKVGTSIVINSDRDYSGGNGAFTGALSVTGSGNSYFNGNVGIGTDEPQAKVHVKDGDIFIEDIDHGIIMKSPDGNCWRGTLNNQGQLQFAPVDCNELSVTVPDNEPGQAINIHIYPNPTAGEITIRSEVPLTNAHVNIYTTAGIQAATFVMNGTTLSVPSGNFSAGFYIVSINHDGCILTSRQVVVQ